ncbi:phosphate acyltransferase PlsX [candidate division KSB1 bacterium]|nr:phosphate acyltransferase PlsX [candidate division KSB1 bacterium]MBL7093281.1 phosphate acyltransferase PlsX [candidate division KSB1 bacterium]
MKIAVDAMGGDFAPREIVTGAISAARTAKKKYEVVLVGDEAKIKHEMALHFRLDDLALSIKHASQQVEMDESPSSAIRRKKDSSIAVCMDLHKKGEVDAVVSAGNTGAVLGSALLKLRKIDKVIRPAIGAILPTGKGANLLIDVGTNVDCRPRQLLQFGIMGSVFVKKVLNIKEPKIGLLNIGEEKSKGNEVVQKAYELFDQSPINFVGNIEGRNILQEQADVIVCDGFVGNTMLKFAESINAVYTTNLRRRIGKRLQYKFGAYLMKPAFRRLKKTFDYAEYGGVPLLGVNGVVIIGHGGSSSKAICNAIFEAEKIINENVNNQIEQELARIETE